MILETDRLILRELSLDDAPFIYALVNDPNWLQYIGDKNVNSLKDARQYIQEKMLDHYTAHGNGFYLVITKDKKESIGITGFINRQSMKEIEVGFAFLSKETGKGFAFESTKAVMEFGEKELKIKNVVAITDTNNTSSQKLLNRLGLHFNGLINLPEFENPCSLFVQKNYVDHVKKS